MRSAAIIACFAGLTIASPVSVASNKKTLLEVIKDQETEPKSILESLVAAKNKSLDFVKTLPDEFDNITVGDHKMVKVDEETKVVNGTAANTTGLVARDEMPMPDIDLLSPEHKSKVGQMFAKVMGTGKNNKAATNETTTNTTTLAARGETLTSNSHRLGHTVDEIEQMFGKVMGLGHDKKIVTNATTTNATKTIEA